MGSPGNVGTGSIHRSDGPGLSIKKNSEIPASPNGYLFWQRLEPVDCKHLIFPITFHQSFGLGPKPYLVRHLYGRVAASLLPRFPVPFAMDTLPSVLIFTYPEHGQANVNLATSYELALAGVNVHIASFESLKARVVQLQELVVRHASRSGGQSIGSVTFREIKGVTPLSGCFMKHGLNSDTIRHPPGVSGALKSYSNFGVFFCPWSCEEYLAGIETMKEIITSIKPNMVVIDMVFYLVRDACTLLGQKFVVILPNSIKDVAADVQPYAAMFWKYPVISSGYSFPLKWWQVPLNIYLVIRLVLYAATSLRMRQNKSLRNSLGLKSMSGAKLSSGVLHICPSFAEIDFPFAVIPQELILCGPIIMPFDPLQESDPALMKWLDNGPTVMINLGSHVDFNEKFASDMASAIRIAIDYHDRRQSSIQVLWKAKAKGNIHAVIDEIIGKEVREGRVKILAWLDVEPVSIMQHPNLICTVHHGGANSFYEGIWSGTPHIVLPVWIDTYDYASRAEYLNVGIFGSKRAAPGVQAEEFGEALVRATGDGEEAAKFRTSAKRLRELCRSRGNGRENSAEAIMKAADIRK